MPSGCNRTASRPPSPGQKFPIHAVPSSVANSTTRPSLPRRAQFAGKPTAKGPYVGNPGSWRNDVILFTLTCIYTVRITTRACVLTHLGSGGGISITSFARHDLRRDSARLSGCLTVAPCSISHLRSGATILRSRAVWGAVFGRVALVPAPHANSRGVPDGLWNGSRQPRPSSRLGSSRGLAGAIRSAGLRTPRPPVLRTWV